MSYLNIDIFLVGATILSTPTTKIERGSIMETTDSTLQYLRETVSALAEKCTDENLLDLICKLLLPSDLGQSV